MQNYESEYQAPPYTVVSKESIGLKVITTVIMDGELMQFEASRATILEGKDLEDKSND